MTGGGENAFSRGVAASLGGRAGSVQKGVTYHPAGEAPVGIEPTNRGFADLCLTTWLRRRVMQRLNLASRNLLENPSAGRLRLRYVDQGSDGRSKHIRDESLHGRRRD